LRKSISHGKGLAKGHESILMHPVRFGGIFLALVEESKKMISYINSKGKSVPVTITRHAVLAMQERYENYYGIAISARQAEAQIVKRFPGCNRLKNLTAHERERNKKYNGSTLYFRELTFTFIVHDRFLKSVEISAKGKRGLNKCYMRFR